MLTLRSSGAPAPALPHVFASLPLSLRSPFPALVCRRMRRTIWGSVRRDWIRNCGSGMRTKIAGTPERIAPGLPSIATPLDRSSPRPWLPLPALLASQHRAQADEDLVRGVAVAPGVHRAAADRHVLGEQEVVTDARAVLAAQLHVVAGRHLPAEAQAAAPRERDARIPVLRRVRRPERGARELALGPVGVEAHGAE